MSVDCLFCKIVAGTIPAKLFYEDDVSLCFADIRPQAPTHLLIIPKEHVASTAYVEQKHAALLGHLVVKAAETAANVGLGGGYRIVVNTGEDGGQTVSHLHLHLLGGRPMNWPPG